MKIIVMLLVFNLVLPVSAQTNQSEIACDAIRGLFKLDHASGINRRTINGFTKAGEPCQLTANTREGVCGINIRLSPNLVRGTEFSTFSPQSTVWKFSILDITEGAIIIKAVDIDGEIVFSPEDIMFRMSKQSYEIRTEQTKLTVTHSEKKGLLRSRRTLSCTAEIE